MPTKKQGPSLTEEEKDMIKDLVHSGQILPILKLMKYFADLRDQDLLTFTYKPGNEQELLHRKSKATGSREFFNSFKRYLEKVKGRKLI